MKRLFLFLFLGLVLGCQEKVNRVEWTTMGTIAAIQWRGDSDVSKILSEVKAAFLEVEEKLNSHNAASEISQLANKEEKEILELCSKEMRPCYEVAFEISRKSGGAFNPRWKGKNTLDFGGIAKGFALDRAVKRLEGALTPDLLIDLGGSLYSVKGSWRVGIAKSRDVILLKEGFTCSTSATYFRGHHICDGRTSKPIEDDSKSVTVITKGNAIISDALSTTIFILGDSASELLITEYNAIVHF